MLKRISDQVAETSNYLRESGLELLSSLKATFESLTDSASSVLDSAADIQAEAIDWIRQKWEGSSAPSGNAATQEDITRLARGIAPVVWLLGKTGAGKSSIIASLTGATHAEVGDGFRPCTLRTKIYDLPQDAPLVRFLDTRGLEEPGYDPEEDINFCRSRAHLVIVVMKAADASQAGVLSTIQKIRKAQPTWPVIVVQTGLHNVYPRGGDHPVDYAFDAQGCPRADSNVPRQLVTLLNHQRMLFNGLKGPKPYFVPIDFTPADEGFNKTDYGKEALVEAILLAAPKSIQRVMQTKLKQEKAGASDESVREAYTALLAAAFTSAKAGSSP